MSWVRCSWWRGCARSAAGTWTAAAQLETGMERRSYAGTEPRPKGGAPRRISTPSSFHCTCSWTTGADARGPRIARSPDAPPCFRRARSSRSSSSPSGPLAQRAGLQALRPGAPAPLLPALGEPGSAQPPYPRPGARVAGAPEWAVRHARRPVGSLPDDRYEPRPGEGEGCSLVR